MKRPLLALAAITTLALAGCETLQTAPGTTAVAATSAAPGTINRIAIPGSDFPISSGVIIPPDAEIYYVSGIVPKVVDPAADPNSRAAYGNTQSQTETIFGAMKDQMEAEGWSLGDIVMMRVYLVADEDTNDHMDFAGFMAGYSKFFGTPEQPSKPARAVVQVASLIRPGWRIEIEAQAARVPSE